MSARERRGSDNLVATSASSSSAATALDEALLGSGGEGEGEAMFGGGGPDGPRTRVSFWLAVLSGLLGAFQFGCVHLIVIHAIRVSYHTHCNRVEKELC